MTVEDKNAVGANQVGLREPEVAAYETTADINVPSGNGFVDIDCRFNLTIATTGGDVLAHFQGSPTAAGFKIVADFDGNRHGDSDHGIKSHVPNNEEFVSFTRLIQELSAGPHVFRRQERGMRLYVPARDSGYGRYSLSQTRQEERYAQ